MSGGKTAYGNEDFLKYNGGRTGLSQVILEKQGHFIKITCLCDLLCARSKRPTFPLRRWL